jgi:Superinfection immunity protein
LLRLGKGHAVVLLTAGAALLAATFSSHPHLERWVAFAMLFPVAIFYLLPSYVAVLRDHPHSVTVTMTNVLLGWTIAGWIGVLIWSFTRWAPSALRLVQNRSRR